MRQHARKAPTLRPRIQIASATKKTSFLHSYAAPSAKRQYCQFYKRQISNFSKQKTLRHETIEAEERVFSFFSLRPHFLVITIPQRNNNQPFQPKHKHKAPQRFPYSSGDDGVFQQKK
jgi:hypothetical protein